MNEFSKLFLSVDNCVSTNEGCYSFYAVGAKFKCEANLLRE